MAANLAAARGLPMAEHVTALLAPALGRLAAHDLVAAASRDAAAGDRDLGEVLTGLTGPARAIEAAGITADQVRAALDPASYLGASAAFTAAALAAHAAWAEEETE
jgi:3-carboxy-cis,cis-muconate cycloisomerase